MKKRIFNKKLAHKCEYCLYGKPSELSGEILCIKRGVTEKRDSCRKYKYDVFKRVPERAQIVSDYTPEDFKL